VELFEEIRREYRLGAGTIQGVAKKLKTHRRMVRQALASAIPPGRRLQRGVVRNWGRCESSLTDFAERSGSSAETTTHGTSDLERIRHEHPDSPVAEATVRRYVRRRKEELGLAARETFVRKL